MTALKFTELAPKHPLAPLDTKIEVIASPLFRNDWGKYILHPRERGKDRAQHDGILESQAGVTA
ncbi:MAG: hypothetical protein IPJ21_16265 [Sterolibacteriaceae bacterium]|nr:hypothetical protein [Sterolibacteriaceae bacterium]